MWFYTNGFFSKSIRFLFISVSGELSKVEAVLKSRKINLEIHKQNKKEEKKY